MSRIDWIFLNNCFYMKEEKFSRDNSEHVIPHIIFLESGLYLYTTYTSYPFIYSKFKTSKKIIYSYQV